MSNIFDSNVSPLNPKSSRRSISKIKKLVFSSQNKEVFFKVLFFLSSGQLISLLSMNNIYIGAFQQTHHFNALFNSLMPFILQNLLTAIFILIIVRRCQKAKLIYIFMAIIHSGIPCLSKFIYIDKDNYHIAIYQLWGFIFLLMFILIRNKVKLSQHQIIGLLISIVGLVLFLSSILFFVLETPFYFISDDIKNNLIGVLQGISTALVIYLQEKHLKLKGDIYSGLLWISFCSFLFCLTISFFLGEFTEILIASKEFKYIDYYKGLWSITINAVIFGIIPFYINKCTSLMLSLCLVCQLYWKLIVDCYLYDKSVGLSWIVGCSVVIFGKFWYCYDIFLADYLNKQNSMIFESHVLKGKREKNEINNPESNLSSDQKIFIDLGDRASVCSAFSSSSSSSPSNRNSLVIQE